MFGALLRLLKHIVAAVFLLVGGACTLEVALRGDLCWKTFCTAPIPRAPAKIEELLLPSRTLYRILPENLQLRAVNPDTHESFTLRTNTFGLRGAEIRVPKPLGLFRVICCGDETIFGAELSEEESFCGQLQEILQKETGRPVEVINAGILGGCPLQNTLYLRQKLIGLQPDLILQHFDMSDVADNHTMQRFTLFGKGPTTPPLSAIHPVNDRRTPQVLDKLEKEFLVVARTRQTLSMMLKERMTPDLESDIDHPQSKYRWLEDEPPDWDVHLQQALKSLEHEKNLAAGYHVPLLVITCPKPWQVSPLASSGPGARASVGVARNACHRSSRPFTQLQEYCEAIDLPLFDATPLFKEAAHPEHLFAATTVTLSPAGNHLYAAQTADFLLSHPQLQRRPTAAKER